MAVTPPKLSPAALIGLAIAGILLLRARTAAAGGEAAPPADTTKGFPQGPAPGPTPTDYLGPFGTTFLGGGTPGPPPPAPTVLPVSKPAIGPPEEQPPTVYLPPMGQRVVTARPSQPILSGGTLLSAPPDSRPIYPISGGAAVLPPNTSIEAGPSGPVYVTRYPNPTGRGTDAVVQTPTGSYSWSSDVAPAPTPGLGPPGCGPGYVVSPVTGDCLPADVAAQLYGPAPAPEPTLTADTLASMAARAVERRGEPETPPGPTLEERSSMFMRDSGVVKQPQTGIFPAPGEEEVPLFPRPVSFRSPAITETESPSFLERLEAGAKTAAPGAVTGTIKGLLTGHPLVAAGGLFLGGAGAFVSGAIAAKGKTTKIPETLTTIQSRPAGAGPGVITISPRGGVPVVLALPTPQPTLGTRGGPEDAAQVAAEAAQAREDALAQSIVERQQELADINAAGAAAEMAAAQATADAQAERHAEILSAYQIQAEPAASVAVTTDQAVQEASSGSDANPQPVEPPDVTVASAPAAEDAQNAADAQDLADMSLSAMGEELT